MGRELDGLLGLVVNEEHNAVITTNPMYSNRTYTLIRMDDVHAIQLLPTRESLLEYFDGVLADT